MSLINIDPANPANTASPAEIKSAGFGGVRLVSRREVDDAASLFQAAGLFVLAVVTEQSAGYLTPHADLWQCGNEPDVDGTADSMSASDYADYSRLYRETYPSLPMITAGLASGQPAYLRSLQSLGALKGFLGIGLHYPENAQTLAHFQTYAGPLPFYVTEWWTTAALIPAYRAMLRQARVALDCRFCWGYDKWALDEPQKRAILATN